MKIKEKTRLRKLIKNSQGNIGSLDMVEFYRDGTWTIMNTFTYSEGRVARKNLGSLAVSCDWSDNINRNITENFRDIEESLNRALEEGQ